VGARRRFRRGLSEPGFETRLAEPSAILGNERLLAHLDTVVARLRVCDNLARILVCGQTFPDEFIETKLFRPSYFHGAPHGDRAINFVGAASWAFFFKQEGPAVAEGPYELRRAITTGSAIFTTNGVASLKDGVTSIEAVVNLSSASSGRYVLQIRRPNLEWNSYPLLLR